jgi:hypothetical protein
MNKAQASDGIGVRNPALAVATWRIIALWQRPALSKFAST